MFGYTTYLALDTTDYSSVINLIHGSYEVILEVDGFEGCKTVLFISPETIRMNDVEHLNYWK